MDSMTPTETLHAPAGATEQIENHVIARATRRDKGVPRKPATPSGALTEQQATEIKRLSQDVADATMRSQMADWGLKKAAQALESYLGALQAGEAL